MHDHPDKGKGPSIRDFFSNLSEPMPLREKLSLLIRNNEDKIWKREDCCDHPGEPGAYRGVIITLCSGEGRMTNVGLRPKPMPKTINE